MAVAVGTPNQALARGWGDLKDFAGAFEFIDVPQHKTHTTGNDGIEAIQDRMRKLKCSEERPTCSQCLKANRDCIPSSGITFRHQQNPSMNGSPHGEGSLKSFYGYKETFGRGVKWVSIPPNLQFVHTNNPYEDGDGDDEGDTSLLSQQAFDNSRRDEDFTLSPSAYPAYATHGLEALSAVASDQYSYAPPQPPMGSTETTLSTEQQTQSSSQHNQAPPSQTLDFILNPPPTLSPLENNIDPRLHTQTPSLSAVPTSPPNDTQSDTKLEVPT